MTGIRSHRLARAGSIALALLLSLSLAPSAWADTTSKILADCGRGQIPKGYSQQSYRKAIKQMSPFLAEYTDCNDLIHRAQLAAVGGARSGAPTTGGGGPVGGSSDSASAPVAPPTPTEQKALEHAHSVGADPVTVGNRVINPGVVHADIASAVSSLPTPLLVVLAFLAACAAVALGRSIRNRVHARRPR